MGRSLNDGGDVQLGADGCFSYRHLRSAGDGPIRYTPSFFIPKPDIDAVAQKISHARENPRAQPTLSIPQDVIDGCEATFEAANEKTQKSDSKRYDASGIFLMTCRHGQIIFFCNIYTPGEQQRYIVASLEELARHLPSQATILQAYDIGCVIDHSLNKFPILRESLRQRVSFIINHMHSYRHEWACQLTFGPRFGLGAGLADHEDVERVWSRTQKMVPITRNQWNSRRILMIDQYAAFLNAEGQENLSTWIERQDKKLRTKLRAALKTFRKCRVPEEELCCQWEDQREAQTSMRSHAPARLRHELDKVLTLQAQIDAVEKPILDAKQAITGSDPPPNTVSLLRKLEATHAIRLNLDRANLKHWLENERLIVEKALASHPDASLLLPLQERQRDLVFLGHRWASLLQPQLLPRNLPLGFHPAEALRSPAEALRSPAEALHTPAQTSVPCYDHTHYLVSVCQTAEENTQGNTGCGRAGRLEAVRQTAAGIVGGNLSSGRDGTSEADGNTRFGCLWSSDTEVDMEADGDDSDVEDGGFSDLPAALQDIGEDGALYPGSIADPEDAADLIGNDDELEETSGLDGDNSFKIFWNVQPQGNLDRSLLYDLRTHNASRYVMHERFSHFIIRGGNLHNLEVEPCDLDRILAPTGRLNGEGINGVAASLHSIYSNQYSPYAAAATRCVLLSTYDLTRVHYKAWDTELWRFLGPTEYWTKALWLIPIHRPVEQHWFCCMFWVAPKPPRYNDTYHTNGDEPWSAYPMFKVNRGYQTNGHDCGLWVLCTLAAVMRGFTGAEVYEADMPAVRKLFADLIRTLPIT
ncbi:hypothetical protein MVEN_02312400 [Mycena venus]|uniref:Ubiquitin-like protease family profile domain-containing protein n=1 Tax=Mycena venus TaxID=2733690 RepID=A0A8H6X421_9AGAR|nr:hypothetical protein MVEN_02312400 [Mycena venus]